MNASTILEAKVIHEFKQSRETVFDAWLDPATVGQWMFGPAIRDEEVVSIEIEPKVGGAFSFLVRRQAVVVDHIGTYLTVERPSTLEFKWGVKGMADSSCVRISIEGHDSGCMLTLIHELQPEWAAYLQRSVEGWGEMLKVLDKTLTSKQ